MSVFSPRVWNLIAIVRARWFAACRINEHLYLKLGRRGSLDFNAMIEFNMPNLLRRDLHNAGIVLQRQPLEADIQSSAAARSIGELDDDGFADQAESPLPDGFEA